MNNPRRPRLSLDLLRGFCAAARHLSFTRAAQELFVTQPAISREIKTLEDQLGQPLFRRVNRALQLTQVGRELFQATEEALALLDAAVDRVAASGKTLAVTTTTALASLWLAPRLPRFARLHPGIDVRVAAVNDMVNLNLEREHLDVAIRFVPPEGDVPSGEQLVDYETFPVCSPRLLRDRARPLRTPADLGEHVLLDFERVAFGRPWSDWEHWFQAMKQRPVRPAATLRFSHYDQVIQAAIEGSGVAIGKTPHLTRLLREGRLMAPFGRAGTAKLGSFFVVVATGSAEREPVTAFLAWLRSEVREDQRAALASPRATKRLRPARAA